MSEKIVGYLLLLVGIFFILISALNVYSIFTKQSQPVDFFEFEAIKIDLGSSITSQFDPKIKEQLITEKSVPTEIISQDQVNKPLNLFTHLVFMGFFVNVGFKIALIGSDMLRNIKLNSKNDRLALGNNISV